MEIRVLGASGGEAPGEPMACFLLGGAVAFEGGSLARSLSIRGQVALRGIILSHAHWDHVRDLPMLADTRAQRGAPPLPVHATAPTIAALRAHVFNGAIWPDFTRIPSRSRPAVRFVEMKPGRAFRLAGMTFRAIPVDHTVPTVGIVASDASGAVVFSGDTGPTDQLWAEAVRLGGRLRAVFVECSFPRRMEKLARISRHLSPDSLAAEVRKLGRAAGRVPVYLYHVKPGYARDVTAQVRRAVPSARLARPGMTIR
ncbi:MAG: 3',5'-cyclic-nucleotide phosphodiesterase [Myxococcota bacterium]|nr:3',5'-cyclic-nucleotide phosphodiesterase [Myxococcota bacterium]